MSYDTYIYWACIVRRPSEAQNALILNICYSPRGCPKLGRNCNKKKLTLVCLYLMQPCSYDPRVCPKLGRNRNKKRLTPSTSMLCNNAPLLNICYAPRGCPKLGRNRNKIRLTPSMLCNNALLSNICYAPRVCLKLGRNCKKKRLTAMYGM